MNGISKNKIKYLKSLRQSKFRQKYNKFVAENDKTALEFLKSNRYTVDEIYVLSDYAFKNENVLVNYGKQVRVITDKEMEAISLLKSHSPVFLVLDQLDTPAKDIDWSSYSIYLDKVQDPGNVGTIIRLADWFGFKGVIRSPDSADFYNPKTVQSTMGSMVNVQLSTALYDEIPENISLMGALLEGEDIKQIQWPSTAVLVIGNESKGIHPALQKRIKQKIYIPGSQGKVAESLNAAIACSIIASEIFHAQLK